MLLFILGVSIVSGGQEPKTFDLDAKPIKTEQSLIGKATKTEYKAVYKGVIYTVYKSPRSNKLFIVYPSSKVKGSYSKKYITEETPLK